jgi:N utilization substance protein B
MAARSKARKRALDILFESEQRDVSALETVRSRAESLNPYTVTLVEGVVARQARIDDLINTYAIGWSMDRMPSVDRAILRLGAYELLWSDDVPDAVVIDEAVALASSLSTDDSPAFVNGMLARLLALKPTLVDGVG